MARIGLTGGPAKFTGFRKDPREAAGTGGKKARKSPNRVRLGLRKWWWNTEPNPRPSSEQEGVRKSPVPDLDHLAVSVDIRPNWNNPVEQVWSPKLATSRHPHLRHWP